MVLWRRLTMSSLFWFVIYMVSVHCLSRIGNVLPSYYIPYILEINQSSNVSRPLQWWPRRNLRTLLPRDANILFNMQFLRQLPDSMRATLADRGTSSCCGGPLSSSLTSIVGSSGNPQRRLLPSLSSLPPRHPPTADGPNFPLSTAAHLHSIAEPRRWLRAAASFHGPLLIRRSVSITSTSDEWHTSASPPANGRETSSGGQSYSYKVTPLRN